MKQRIQRSFNSLSHPITRQSIAFFLFGTINNAIYVVILTAALELIPKGTPTGLVAFFNIFPALIAKAIWPYVLKGTVRYTRRIWSCVSMSFVGLLVIALLPSLYTRLAGIALASFSSGLGELTFLQLSTRFSRTGAGRAVGWFSSGTGAAGLVGASAWWIVRPLGVTEGLLSLSFLPVGMGFTYAVILTSVQAVDDAEEDAKGSYEPLQAEAFDVGDDSEGEEESESSDNARTTGRAPSKSAALSLRDKIELIKPMLFVYIVPLVMVYFFEYTINQGVAPTLLYPLPTRSNHPLLSLVIKKLKDYYPFYQLTYQTFVFLSRSSISIFRMPAIPKRYLWVPAILQGLLLIILTTESIYAWFRASIASPLSIVLVCVEGLAGGSAYVSVFYQIGTDNKGSKAERIVPSRQNGQGHEQNGHDEQETEASEARRAQEHEFRIGCVGVGDTMGIMAAALFSMPLELALCDAQVQRGRDLCKQV
ncbi:batten's disease protein Cln3 [Meira miltonrushii]|uniref:Protein BTN n=1 Tax=Meira miltonrushii TaxID=1280837 RepID=A0A316V908_9BASI|nr:batten's disease protein Cln3 [Meira miltonrushii]PWN33942.1 batten's disease protein Cln3 [Meira miltonrushii]